MGNRITQKGYTNCKRPKSTMKDEFLKSMLQLPETRAERRKIQRDLKKQNK